MLIHNPTDLPVPGGNQRDEDYGFPIQDPVTKKVHLWNIQPGETLDFPDYAGQELLNIYGFLQHVMTQEEKDQKDRERAKINKGQHFTQEKIIPARPTQAVIPPTHEGFTNVQQKTPATTPQADNTNAQT